MAPSSGSGASTTPRDLFHWSHWWHLERDLYLWDPVRLRRPPISGDDGATVPHPRPSVRCAMEDVLPGVLAQLRTSRHDDIITASLVASARIGSRLRPDQRVPLIEAILAQLKHRSLEVAETAAVTLGILGDRRSVPVLIALLRDTGAGHELTGRQGVPERVRAFAAYGLGLMMAQGAELEPGDRQRAALALMETLEAGGGVEDVAVASVIALGLSGLPLTASVPPEEVRAHRLAVSVVHRGALARWMLPRFAGDAGKSLPPRALAHGAVALARIGRELPSSAARDAVLSGLVNRAGSRAIDQRHRAALWIGVGVLANSGESDAEARRALVQTLHRGQPLERRFAAISLAWASSRPGSGEEPFAGAEHARSQLERRLAKGTEQDRTWVALALGVQAHALGEQGALESGSASSPLLELARRSSNASTAGAFAIAAALAHVRAGEDDVRKLIESIERTVKRVSDPSTRGHVAIALGILGARGAAEPLDEILDISTFQPEPLWSAAVALHLIRGGNVTERLVAALAEAKSGVSRAAAAAALGRVGDTRAVAPLVKLMNDTGQVTSARALAIVGLGVLCDEERSPWRVPIAHALPYASAVTTLWGGGRGVLDIL